MSFLPFKLFSFLYTTSVTRCRNQKVAQFLQRIAQKVSKLFLLKTKHFSKHRQKSTNNLATLVKNCNPELSKVAQSGYTAPNGCFEKYLC